MNNEVLPLCLCTPLFKDFFEIVTHTTGSQLKSFFYHIFAEQFSNFKNNCDLFQRNILQTSNTFLAHFAVGFQLHCLPPHAL